MIWGSGLYMKFIRQVLNFLSKRIIMAWRYTTGSLSVLEFVHCSEILLCDLLETGAFMEISVCKKASFTKLTQPPTKVNNLKKKKSSLKWVPASDLVSQGGWHNNGNITHWVMTDWPIELQNASTTQVCLKTGGRVALFYCFYMHTLFTLSRTMMPHTKELKTGVSE